MKSTSLAARLLPALLTALALGTISHAAPARGEGEADPQDTMQPTWRHPHGVYLFEENFDHGSFLSWSKYTLDDAYALDLEPPRSQWGQQKRIHVIPAPLSDQPSNQAVRFIVPRAINSFRSELALTAEPGFHERWYGLRIFVPADWVFNSTNSSDSGDIVTQWHHIIGINKAALGKYPPLSIEIKDSIWHINSNYGVEGKAQREYFDLPGKVEAGKWTAWVAHIKWSPYADGVLQIWKDGKLVVDKTGPNTYQSDRPRTPYWKIGIYHPAWKTRNVAKFNAEKSPITERVIVIDDVRMGTEAAKYADVAP